MSSTVLMELCSGGPAHAAPELAVRMVSSRPDAVSGEEALVQIVAPRNSRWSAQLDGRDVTASFRAAGSSGNRLALLTGLTPGRHTLRVQVDGATRAQLELIDHPLAGPIFSGPRQRPFVCQTAVNGLGPALAADCSAKTVVQYYYKSMRPVSGDSIGSMIKSLRLMKGESAPALPAGFAAYDGKRLPADVARTVTADGQTVPYVIRREIGVINRAVYDIRFLHQPGQPLPTPWSHRGTNWNGRLVYDFGGGCNAGYRQGVLRASASHEALLAQGYAVAAATLNIFGNTCNHVVSAETLSMVKEHFIESYGQPVHTIGWGDSGGAVQLHLIVQNYPGLLDGIIPYISFPDMLTYVQATGDCAVLSHALSATRQVWTDAQKTAVAGFAGWGVCAGIAGFALDPKRCPAAIAPSQVYDAVRRPKGIRCDLFSNGINVFGRDPRTGRAARPYDNVGVQYGLLAFNAGKIDAEQFVDLNERIGGLDGDGSVMAGRARADAEIVERVYRRGLILTGGGGLPDTPIIDWRWYADDLLDNHDSFRSFLTRARLVAANGTALNQVILIDPRAATLEMSLARDGNPNPEASLIARKERELVGLMDRWLGAVAADTEAGTRAQKVVRNKPADLVDTCRTTDGERITGNDAFGVAGRCGQIYPQHADPRIAAGGPVTDDVLKCELKPVSPADYAHPLTAAQLGRLRAAFPSGVCDYSRRGVGQQVTQATWQSF